MKAASVKEIKTELETLPEARLLEVCMRLAKFRKENKELITYLLFEEQDELNYILGVKAEIDLSFTELNTKNLYIAKKNIRKIIRMANRYIKYSAQKTTEASLLIHVCMGIKDSGIDLTKSTVLNNIYNALLKKINAAIDTMHEDLQYDYRKELEAVT